MRKTILLFALLLIIVVALSALIYTDVKPINLYDVNTGYYVKFHISGCTEADCKGFTYCIDGGSVQYVNNCTFTVNLSTGQHSICAHCPINKWGYLEFTVTTEMFQDQYVNMQGQSGEDCSCTPDK